MTRRIRYAWVVAVFLAVVLALVGVQAFNTRAVGQEICSNVLKGTDCKTLRTGFISLKFPLPLPGLAQQAATRPSEVNVDTRLIRKTCAGGWTAFGGRAQIDKGLFSQNGTSVEHGRVCADLSAAGVHGTVGDARLSSGACVLRISPFAFNVERDLQATLSATIDPATANACSETLFSKVEGAGAMLASARLDLTLRYGISHRHSAATNADSTRANQESGTIGMVRSLLSSMPTSHALTATFGAAKASLTIETQPARDSAALRFSARVDPGLSAQFGGYPGSTPDAPMELDVRWPLNHETGHVTVNGKDIARLPVTPTRPVGRLILPVTECKSATESGALFFVELGEKGEALRPAQVDMVLRAVEQASPNAGALVTVFVHGWHHSASRDDEYVCRFSDVLASIREMEKYAAGRANRSPRDVIGVYVGWPGALYPSEVANSVTTFWNRLDVADRLGADGGVLQSLIANLSARLHKGDARPQADRRSSLVVAGHSMGARAVFNALDDQAGERAATATAVGRPDLVVLVNPAFSAALYRSVHTLTKDCRPGNVPFRLFSSEADGVTRRLYPAGQTVTYSYDTSRPSAFLEHVYTAANFAEFVTHRLTMEVISGMAPDPGGPQTILRGHERIPVGSMELYEDRNVTVYRQPSKGRPAPDDAWYRMHLAPVNAGSNCQAPGMSAVIGVDPRILPDHGRIFTPPFVEYIVRMLNRQAASRRPAMGGI